MLCVGLTVGFSDVCVHVYVAHILVLNSLLILTSNSSKLDKELLPLFPNIITHSHPPNNMLLLWCPRLITKNLERKYQRVVHLRGERKVK